MDLPAIILLFVATSCATGSSDRRQALSYSTSIVHGDLRYPDQHAQSSIDFHIGQNPIYYKSFPDHQQQAQIGSPSATGGHRAVYMGFEEGQKFNGQGHHGMGQKFQGQGFNGNGQNLEGQGFNGKGQKFEGQGFNGKGQSLEGQGFNGKLQKFEGQGFNGKGQSLEGQSFNGKLQKFEGQGFNGKGQSLEGQGFNGKGHKFEGFNGQPEVAGFNGGAAKFGEQGQSQSFNVGYSVKFGGPRPKKSRHESDVITGSFKEEVANPFLRTANSDEQLIQQAHLTPKTNSAYLDTFQRPEASPWRSLSPSVEIYKSSEVKKGFDHGRALGKSEGFDYTNAVEFKPFQPQFRHAERVQEVANTHTGSPKALPRLPIDTSLIRDPVLTTNRQTSMSSKQIPIHFDTSLIRQMSKTGLDQSYIPLQSHLDYNLEQPKALPLVQQNQDLNNLQPEQSKNNYQINFSYPQNGLFDPQILTRSSKSKSMYSVSEAVEDNLQPQQTQFKVFGKPQNNFMRHEYEKAKAKAGHRAYSPRRTVRNWMDLRPPPLVYARRRIYV